MSELSKSKKRVLLRDVWEEERTAEAADKDGTSGRLGRLDIWIAREEVESV